MRLPTQQFRRVLKSSIVALDKMQALDGNQLLFEHPKAYVPLFWQRRTRTSQKPAELLPAALRLNARQP